MKNRIIKIIVLLFIGLTYSCNKSFLDVSDELAQERTLEETFASPGDTKKFHRNIYTGIPNSMDMWWNSFDGLGNPWPFIADELTIQNAAFRDLQGITVSTGRYAMTRWNLYKLIRQANLFLENAVEIPQTGSADFLAKEELDGMKAEARFLRAYYHYLLFELLGPIPIMNKSVDAAEGNLDFARNSVDEVVNFIFEELTAVAEQLEDPNYSNLDRLAVPTKGTALAIRARLMVYAASPLFNGGFQEALSLKNVDGKRLFPDKNPTKWDKALSALQEFIDYSVGHYELHKVYFSNNKINPGESLYQVHMKMNKEIIFARSKWSFSGGPTADADTRQIPRVVRGSGSTSGGVGVRQELVDAFFMADGLSIEESPLYEEGGFSVSGDDLTNQTEVGTRKMFINREPRFYQTVFYNGRKWHVGNEQVWFNKGGNSDNTSYAPASGHFLYKRLSKRVYQAGTNPKGEYRPPIVHRLAEFYLLYAEALNEVSPSDPRIIEYLDKIRERAGIPLYRTLHDDAIKTGVIGNQDAQRKAIRAEMRVELATEGQRYFDINRWMIAEEPSGEGRLNGEFYGMDMNAPTLEGFYRRVVIHNRVWSRANYLYPMPLGAIQKSELLIQNPEY